MSRQRTIANEAVLTGRGLFTGGAVTTRFKPAPPGSGITFVRTDQVHAVRIPATIENLTKRARRTAVKNGTVAVETVEHCLAAVRGLGIDNVDIELNNDELPAADGSCKPFVDALNAAGVIEQEAERVGVLVCEPIRVFEGGAELVAWPGSPDRLDILYELDYGDDTPIGRQFAAFSLDVDDFVEQIAPARTFVLEREVRALQSAGLGLHLSYDDILVVGPDGPIKNTLRFPNECVRHKILDLIGDLTLLGCCVAGRIYARRSGHHLNHELVRRLRELRTAEAFGRPAARPKLDVRSVQRVLPHRFPMLLVDRVLEIDGDRRAVGIKNVTINEPYFQGHYPRQPIMPGVLIIEAMAQLGGLLVSQKLEHTGKVAVLLSLDRVKFRRPVVPGDQLVLAADAVNVKSRHAQVFCQARVGDELAAEASIRFMLVDAEPS
ncbi:MAG: UDP-3-O-acyl-N-acetylglucosamine deacetylase [Phycisphaerae bacterium]